MFMRSKINTKIVSDSTLNQFAFHLIARQFIRTKSVIHPSSIYLYIEDIDQNNKHVSKNRSAVKYGSRQDEKLCFAKEVSGARVSKTNNIID